VVCPERNAFGKRRISIIKVQSLVKAGKNFTEPVYIGIAPSADRWQFVYAKVGELIPPKTIGS
jgi:hypothetical protein